MHQIYPRSALAWVHQFKKLSANTFKHGSFTIPVVPANQAYFQNVHARAKQLFAELGVWDTEYNSGILLYINLCEKSVEIVIDRGIKDATSQADWNQICDGIVMHLRQQKYREGVIDGIVKIGEILHQYYLDHEQDQNQQNEISNKPIIL